MRNYWNYLKFCGVIQISVIFGCAQVKIFMRNGYTIPRVCTQEKYFRQPFPEVCGACGINICGRDCTQSPHYDLTLLVIFWLLLSVVVNWYRATLTAAWELGVSETPHVGDPRILTTVCFYITL
jgi:hypothetical protein